MTRRTKNDSAQNTIFAGASTNVGNNPNVSTSRLLENSNNLRQTLSSRNLYDFNNEYAIGSQSKTDRIVESVNSVIGILTPFKSFNLKNSVIGRLVTDSTPLTEIGLTMLGNQFLLNSISQTSRETFPVIKVSNLFDKNRNTKLFTLNVNSSITKKPTGFRQFLDNFVYFYPARDYPFNKNSKNSDFIKFTGEGQLSSLYNNINQNIYIQDDNTLKDFGELNPRSNLIAIRPFFTFNNEKQHPYSLIPLNSEQWNVDANI